MSQKNHEPTQIKLLSDQEMDELKGEGLWIFLKAAGEAVAVAITVGKGAHDLGGYLGTKYGESVTNTSGGIITTPSKGGGYWQCGQSPCKCGACGQGQGGRPGWY